MQTLQIEVVLTLDAAEVNTILASLGKHPFDQISQLIEKIKQQGDPQVSKFLEKQMAAQRVEPVPAQPAE